MPPGRQVRRRRVEVVAVAAFALGMALLLSAIRVPQARVVIDLVVDEVGFAFQEDWDIQDLPLRQLSTTNARSLVLVDGVTDPGEAGTDGKGGDLEIRGRSAVSAWQAWMASEYLRLNLTVPAGTQTRLSLGEGNAGTLRMTLGGGTTHASLDTGDELEVRCTSCLAHPGPLDPRATGGEAWTVHPAARRVVVEGADRPLMLSMQVGRSGETAMALIEGAPLATRVVDFSRASNPEVSAVSGPGSIVFPSLATGPIPIAPGEFVVVRARRPLSVYRLALGDAIEVELRGTVSKLLVGRGGALRSQKPTLLAYLWGNKWLQIVLGATLTIGAAASTILYRLGLGSGWNR